MDDYILEEIGRLVKDGFTSGILDDGETGRIVWNINIEKVGESKN